MPYTWEVGGKVGGEVAGGTAWKAAEIIEKFVPWT
jgi:hypothetical protein